MIRVCYDLLEGRKKVVKALLADFCWAAVLFCPFQVCQILSDSHRGVTQVTFDAAPMRSGLCGSVPSLPRVSGTKQRGSCRLLQRLSLPGLSQPRRQAPAARSPELWCAGKSLSGPIS